MGIEPTSPGWKPGALPLSYTRLTRRDRTLAPPEGDASIPLPGSGCYRACLATGHLTEVSPLSGRAIFQPLSRPLQPGIRFLRDPLPTEASVSLTGFLVSERDTSMGLPRSAQATRIGWVPPFRRWSIRQRTPTKQRSNRPHPILGGAYQALWPIQPYGVYQRFACANPSIQPSSSPVAPTGSRCPLTGEACPRGVATLSGRLAHVRYQSCTAPRLRVAGHPVHYGCYCR